MRRFLVLVFITILIYNCSPSKSSKTKPEHLISENASLILKINDYDAFKTDLINNSITNNILASSLDSIISIIESLNVNSIQSPLFVSINDKLKTDFSIIGKLNDSAFNINPNLHYNIIDSVFVVSNSKTRIDNLEIQQESKVEFSKISDNKNSFSIYINDSINRIRSSLLKNDITLFPKSTTLNFEASPESINFNGTNLINDSIISYLDIFKQTVPQENQIAQVSPINSDAFSSFTFSDFSTLFGNLMDYNKLSNDSIMPHPVFETIQEFGEIFLNEGNALVFKSLDSQTTKDALIELQEELSSYRTIPIYKFNPDETFTSILNPLISTTSYSQYIILDDFFIFSNSESVLQNIITNYQNNSTLSNSKNYNNLKQSLSDESSVLLFFNRDRLQQTLDTLFNSNFNTASFKDYNYNAIQFITDDGFTHINGIIKKEKTKSTSNSITEEFNISLDNDILMTPHFVTNHRTKEKDVVVQDINNNLYLISNKGKVLWKKQINGNILGQIQQVDLYKNGRLQLAFATPNRVYIIDRNGNDVSPFPLQFNDPITQPLSIFDYDNNKNYRFLVTQGNALLMYDKRGKRVNGFRYNPTNTISTQPKHFRISGRDYIVFGMTDKIKILNRQGKDRINVNESIDLSNNPIYRFNDRFTTTSNNGELIQINLKGNVSKQVLNLESNHSIEATNRTLITLSDNILNIKQNSIELDFGNYTSPKLFYLNDKIYISITDLQTQKVFMFDSQAKTISNFPVYGNSTIDMANADRDSNLEFVTKGDSNSIILYQKN